ncbi:nose resistant to fluoxetine protein 6-like [Periplaneta americana]|uniref:nose resistant to fluoxetine protein 6-like n=1 Tax=Periplaneta americana TaxID=6978 RepID=UPI0037E9BEBE
MVALSTAYDVMNKGERRELLLSFSLRRHGSKLLSADTSSDSLPALHGVRSLSMCWIVLGHHYFLIKDVSAPAINIVFINRWVRSWENMPLVNFVMAVDTFLLLSGLLVAYVFLKQMRRPDAHFNIPLHYLHRYIRLTPVLAALMLIQLSLMDHLGSGPIWGTNVYQTELCRRNWWAALLYIQNYYSGDQTMKEKFLDEKIQSEGEVVVIEAPRWAPFEGEVVVIEAPRWRPFGWGRLGVA